MATETKIIELKVEYGGALSRIAELTNAIENLSKKEMKAGETIVEYKNRMAEHTTTIKMHRQEIALLSREVANKWKVDQQELGHIEKLKAEVANLTLTYERLTKAELEGAKGTTVLNDLKGKREELAKLNQAYGNYGLNVGNYSSATKMLGINLGQVMKEMPNFAISARIGIMSLTNNLPMLAESIKAVRLEQQELIAAGKAAPSMFGMITKSIFGLTGIMSIAMVLMQIFGADIIKWIGGLVSGKKAIDDTAARMATFNEIAKKGSSEMKTAYNTINKVEIAFSEYKKGVLTATEALGIYNKELGDQLGRHTDINAAMQTFTDKAPAYIELQWKMALVAEFQKKGAEKYIEANIEKTKSDKEFAKWYEKLWRTINNKRQYDDEYYANIAPSRRKEGYDKAIADANVYKKQEEQFQTEAIEYAKANGLQILDLNKKNATHNSRIYHDAKIKDFDFSIMMQESLAKTLSESQQKEEDLFTVSISKKKEKVDNYIEDLILQGNKINETINQTKDPKVKKQAQEDLSNVNNALIIANEEKDKLFFQFENERQKGLLEIRDKWDNKNFEKRVNAVKKEFDLVLEAKNKSIDEETKLKVKSNKLETDLQLRKNEEDISLAKEQQAEIKNVKSDEYIRLQRLLEQYYKIAENIALTGNAKEVDIIQMGKEKKLQYTQEMFRAELGARLMTQNESLQLQLKEQKDRLKITKNGTDAEKLEYEKLKADIAKTQEQIAVSKFQDIEKYVNQFVSGISNIISNINSAETDSLQVEKNKQLALAGDNAVAREQIERDYAKKELDLKKKQANAAMGISIAQAVATGALGIAEIWAKHSGIPFVGVPMATALTALLGGITIANIAAAVAQRDVVQSQTLDSSSSSGTTSTVTEKFHTGGTVGNTANTPNKSEEITATLLKGEEILTRQQRGVFNSILGNIKSMGGSSSITNGVGVNNMNQLDMMTMAFSLALQNQKPQYVAWRDFKEFDAKMAIFEQNKTI